MPRHDAKQRLLHEVLQGNDALSACPYLHLILDAARDESIYPWLVEHQSRLEMAPLVGGSDAHDLAEVAPYLLRLSGSADLFDWYWDRGWGRAWGILIWSTSSITTLRSHFARLWRVHVEPDDVVFMRYYDPRVLPSLWQVLTAEQLTEVFRPVSMLWAEEDGGKVLGIYSPLTVRARRLVLTDV